MTSLMRKIYPEKEYGANGSAEPVRYRRIAPERVGHSQPPHASPEPSAPPCVITTQAPGTPNSRVKAAGNNAEVAAQGNADVVAEGKVSASAEGTEHAGTGNSASSARSLKAAVGDVRRDASNGSSESAGGLKRSSGDSTSVEPNGPDPPLKRAKEDG